MATGTPFHDRTAPLNRSLAWKDWAGYHAATRFNEFHQPEYAAIRNGAAVIDVSPLYKYRVAGPDAEALLDRVMTRDMSKCAVGQVVYAPWCDIDGAVLQEGTVMRRAEDVFQLNAAEPAIRWLRLHAAGHDATVEDVSRETAALAVQGPTSRDLLDDVTGGAVGGLRFFRETAARIGDIEVVVSRTGYTGDLGYEVWVPAAEALRVWDVLMAAGKSWGARPCGLQAMDVARIEAGFILIGVDYVSAERAKIRSQKSSPFEIGLGWAVHLDKARPAFGHEALVREKRDGSAWQHRGLVIDWEPLETVYAEAGLMPDLPTVAWRQAVPLYAEGRQVGRATSGCWSTLLKQYVVLASLETPWAGEGETVEMEVTVDYARRRVPARIVRPPFFRPARLRA